MLCEKGEVLEILPAGVGGVELAELAEDHAPRLHLLRRVLHPGDGLSAAGRRGEGRLLRH